MFLFPIECFCDDTCAPMSFGSFWDASTAFCTKKLLSLLEHQLGHIIALCQSKCGVTVKECTTSLGAAPLSRKSWNSSTQLLRTTSASWASCLYIDEILQIKHIKHRKANRPESMIRQFFVDSCFVFKNNHQISPMFCPKHGALTVLHALLHRSHATATGCTIGYSPTDRCPAQLKHQDKAWDTPQIYSNLQTIGHSMHSWFWYVDSQDKNGCWTKFGVFEPSPGVQILSTRRPPAVGSAQWRRARPWHRNMLKKNANQQVRQVLGNNQASPTLASSYHALRHGKNAGRREPNETKWKMWAVNVCVGFQRVGLGGKSPENEGIRRSGRLPRRSLDWKSQIGAFADQWISPGWNQKPRIQDSNSGADCNFNQRHELGHIKFYQCTSLCAHSNAGNQPKSNRDISGSRSWTGLKILPRRSRHFVSV